MVDQLIKEMPIHRGPLQEEDQELEGYDYITYMEKMMGYHRELNGDAEGERRH